MRSLGWIRFSALAFDLPFGVGYAAPMAKDDIADLALFLRSSATSYVPRAVMVCAGGRSLLGSGALLSAMTGG